MSRKDEIAKRRARLSSDKRSLLADRLKKAKAVSADPPPSPKPTATRASGPLSFAQQRLWFLDQLQPGTPNYNIPLVVRLKGSLRVHDFNQALQQIIDRHHVLRTTFQLHDGEARQVIAPTIDFPLKVVDFRDLNPTLQNATVAACTRQEGQRPFDLSMGPLLRVALYLLNPTDSLLLVNMHHIISDGWSVGVFVREMAAHYQDPHSQPPPLPMQYVEFAVEQREWLRGAVLEKQIGYWKTMLGGGLPILATPLDRPRPALQTFAGGSLELTLPNHIIPKLETLENKYGVTSFMVFLAVFQTLLHRYAGQTDILIGTPIANRNRPGIEHLIGFFVNTLVLRADLTEPTRFNELLEQTRGRALAAFDHQDIPFEKLVEALQPERNRSHAPLFQVMFILQNTPFKRLALNDLTLEPYEMDRKVAKFDLTLELERIAAGYICTLEYNTDLFDRETIARLGKHYGNLVTALLDQPDAKLAQIDFMDADERRQLTALTHGPETTRLDTVGLYQHFAAQAAATPDKTALCMDDPDGTTHTLSYAELEQRVNRLAAHLRTLGVGAEQVVGVCLPRSPQMIVALLAVLKAGAAYLPMDPNHPDQRLHFLITDGRVRIVLAENQHPAILDQTVEQVLSPDQAQASPTINFPTPLPDNAAYVIYTSGSTGRPKGVVGTQRATLNRLAWMWEKYPFAPNEVCCQKTTLSFVDSVWEIFGPLLKGIPLVLIPDSAVKDPRGLWRAMTTHQISRLVLVPSLLRAMLNAPANPLPTTRLWITSGEALPVALLKAFRTAFPQATLLNLYGSSEVAADVTHHAFHPNEATDQTPIGLPIDNCQTWVLDTNHKPAALGVRGHLYIGGMPLARCYQGDPNRTAETFIPNPYAQEPGQRLYRTGDLVRRRWDGVLLYQGRADHQVKIRGFRVEPGEIEAALASHQAVAEAAVVTRGQGENTRLVGFTSLRETTDRITPATLIAHLHSRLPAYMIPANITILPALPHTASGKIDRTALPQEKTRETAVTPRTPEESMLADIWARLLERETVGVESDFFSLGGHSLMATRVIAQIREIFEVDLPLGALFEAPTVAALCRLIERTRNAAEAVKRPPLTRCADQTHPPLSEAQERLWFIDQLEGGGPAYNMPTALTLTGSLHIPALSIAAQRIIDRHESLRTTFRTEDHGPYQHIIEKRILILPLIDLSRLQDPTREPLIAGLARNHALYVFDLTQDHSPRLALIRASRDRHVLLINMHHIVSDGWSIGVLIKELAAFYNHALTDPTGEASIPEPTIRYRDFAHWQRQWLGGPAGEMQLNFWRDQLKGLPPLLELATDRPRPSRPSQRGASLPLNLEAAESKAVHQLARMFGATPHMVLTAIYGLMLSRYSGQTDLCIGTPVANRNHPALDGLIGFFVNNLALRLDLSGDPSFGELVARVRRTALAAYHHQDISFARVVNAVSPTRDTAHAPLFQVLFTLQNAPTQALHLPGLALEVMPTEGVTARLDLALAMHETADGFQGSWEYASDLFEAQTVQGFSTHLRALLKAAQANPERRISRLEMLTEADRRLLLHDWQSEDSDIPIRTVPMLLAEGAANAADRIACLYDWEDGTQPPPQGLAHITFAMFSLLTDRLATTLRKRGVRSGDMVAVCMTTRLEQIIAIYGVMKAGAAYVPLDPSLPQERLRYMAQDATATLIITTREHQDLIQSAETQLLDNAGTLIQANQTTADDKPEPPPIPQNSPAYMIYTSGSTGKPKGVVVPHEAVCRELLWRQSAFPLQPSEAILQKFSFSLDASVWEYLAAPSVGAKVVLTWSGGIKDAAYLTRAITRHRVTIIQLVPSLIRALLDESGFQRARTLRWIMSGGEALNAELVRELHEQLPDAVLVNLYGPTEGCIDATYQPTTPNQAEIPIGKPITDMRVHVLDASTRLVPAGVPGELHLGGAHLAWGYHGRPDLTAAAFIPDPFSQTGARLYKTGDLVKWRADGHLLFLGRTDYQVKLRGFRVELGEIEAVLAKHPAVREVGVVMRRFKAGDQRPVAFLQPQRSGENEIAPPDDETLKAELAKHLPDYMIPAAFVWLEHMVLDALGKINRRALPDFEETHGASTYTAPRTDTEQALAAIWAEVLQQEAPGIHDDFFVLGGHSILATRVMSRVRETFNVDLPLRTLFEHTTIAALAAVLSAADPQQTKPVETVAFENEAPLSFAQERMWFLEQLNQTSLVYHMPSVLELRGRCSIADLVGAIEGIAARHEILRARFIKREGGPIQTFDGPFEGFPHVVDLSGMDPTRAKTLADQEAARPFDLERGPLLRTTILRLQADHHILLVTMHHIISDGWSMGLLIKELSAFYRARISGTETDLPPLQRGYGEYARRQRQDAQTKTGGLDYWKDYLRDAPPLLELPTDRPRPAVQTFAGAVLGFHLEPELTTTLKQLATENGVTLFVVLRAGLAALLARYSGQDDVILGVPVANRNQRDLEPLIGLFLNTLATRTGLSRGTRVNTLLHDLQQDMLDVLAHQNVPFERVVEAVQPQRDLSHAPLFQVMFTLQNTPPAAFQLPGLTVTGGFGDETSLEGAAAPGIAKFDLTITAIEAPYHLTGTFEFNTDLFDTATIRNMMGQYKLLLAGMAADPTRPILDLDLVDEEERRALLAFTSVIPPYPETPITRLIQNQAARFPDRIALSFDDRTVSFAALMAHAFRLAHHLRELGVTAEVPVGLMLGSGFDFVPCILAVQLAGGWYVPLDSAYPPARLKYMVADSGLKLVITDEADPTLGADLTFLSPQAGMDTEPTSLPDPLLDNQAYQIYTSGSTGQPKGVAVSHRALYYSTMARLLLDSKPIRLLQTASFSFDASVGCFYWTLCEGATLLTPPPALRARPADLAREIVRQQITHAMMVPSVFALLRRHPLDGLQQVILAGEALPASFTQTSPPKLINEYGPTETCVWATVFSIEGPMQTVPLGRAIANARVYIIDQAGNLNPSGIPDELLVGGPNLARGYAGRPDLTAARFVPDAFSGEAGARLYRTGDLVRRAADGLFYFLGRRDQQIKIRGFRIEPGEVENAVSRLAQVKGVVVDKRIIADDPRLVAYVEVDPDLLSDAARLDRQISEWRVQLRAEMPEHLVPALFHPLQAFPRAAAGKIDRRALAAISLSAEKPTEPASPAPPQSRTAKQIAAVWCEALGVERVGLDDNFFDLGGHSLLLTRVHAELQKLFGNDLPLVELFRRPTVRGLADYLSGSTDDSLNTFERRSTKPRATHSSKDIAVVGYALAFPGARDAESFWRNLVAGVESVSRFSDETLLAEGVDPDLLIQPNFVPAGAVLEDIDLFDAGFFAMHPREAETTDPQQRLFLELAWHALEHAALDPDRFNGDVGVFAGSGLNAYLLNNLLGNPSAMAALGAFQGAIGNDKDFMATRVSYKLGLSGPSINVQNACSTSLVAVHLACQSLLNGDCDAALAGGSSLRVPQKSGYLYEEGMILSPDGHCRAFDADARGTVGGNGAAALVLMRLEDALAEGYTVHGVIKGSALNNDGRDKVGFTAPGVNGQASVIVRAMENAAVAPDTIGYVEAHGTGTPLGDPIEVKALQQAFHHVAPDNPIALGSVKTNFGHLDTAAGAAGLIKTLLALKHCTIPPSLNYHKPNPAIDFAAGPFYVNTENRPWLQRGDAPRRAGVSSFGIGGTNAHVVVEEAPTLTRERSNAHAHLLTLSAKSPEALARMASNLAHHLERTDSLDLADAAFTLQAGRTQFEHRQILVAETVADAIAGLRDPARTVRRSQAEASQVVFMFSGQGGQYAGMAGSLYNALPLFREVIDQGSAILEPLLGLDPRSLLVPSENMPDDADQRLRQTELTQPLLFLLSYALGRQMTAFGVRPSAMIGHSIGEFAAACLAEVFSFEDGLELVATRGRLMGGCPKGAMLAVSAQPENLPLSNYNGLNLASVNGRDRCVVAGPTTQITAFQEAMNAEGIPCRLLHTSHAFHSSMIEPALEPFQKAVAALDLQPPCIPFISNRSGTWITEAQATDPAYWARHLRETVRFADGLDTIAEMDHVVPLELGPGHSLTNLARRSGLSQAVNGLPHAGSGEDAYQHFLGCLGRLWLAGAGLDWSPLHQEGVRRIPLPLYPYARKRYWIEAVKADSRTAGRVEPGAAMTKRHFSHWFYRPQWREAILASDKTADFDGPILLFTWATDSHKKLTDHLLKHRGVSPLIKVTPGNVFKALNDNRYVLRPDSREDYALLADDLHNRGLTPKYIIHAWLMGEAVDETLDWQFGFHALTSLAAAMIGGFAGASMHLTVVVAQAVDVSGGEQVVPARAALTGLCTVIPMEYPNLTCRLLDIGTTPTARLLPSLTTEIARVDDASPLALRGSRRWSRAFIPMPPTGEANLANTLRSNGVYLITGGFGNIGLTLAHFLIERVGARVALLGRHAPEPEQAVKDWPGIQPDHPLLSLPQIDNHLLAVKADASNETEMRAAFKRVDQHFGGLHGVFHAAGLTGPASFAALDQLAPDRIQDHFDAKVKGTQVLARVAGDLDFIVLFSSVASVLGGLGFAAYASVNAYMDAFAQDRNRRDDFPWLTINWDGWYFPKDAETPPAQPALLPQEGMRALAQILASIPESQVIVSVSDLNARLARWVDRPKMETDNPDDEAGGHARPELTNSFAAPETDQQKKLAAIWEHTLGIQPIGLHDNFFELGGDSLLATQILSQTRQAFKRELALTAFFENPTVAGLAAQLEHDTGEPTTAPAITPAPADAKPVLSFAQQRMWFLDQLDETHAHYTIASELVVSGQPDYTALADAINQVVVRHQVLRTLFQATDRGPVPRLVSDAAITLPVIDVSGLDAAICDRLIPQIHAAEMKHPFDLAEGPLLRVMLLKRARDKHLFFANMHHIVSDAWSMALFIKELSSFYTTRVTGAGGLPGRPPIQYADFAHWQRAWLQGEVMQAELDHWRAVLQAPLPRLQLPNDGPDAGVMDRRGGTCEIVLEPALTRGLKRLSVEANASLFMTLLAAFAMLLQRYSRQDDIILGAPIAGRNRAETEDLIGCFLNMLALRVDLSGNPSFRQFLGRVATVTLDAFAHQDIPFERLVEELQPDRQLDRHPIFDVLFNFINTPSASLSLPGLHFEPAPPSEPEARFSMTLYAQELGERLLLQMVYRRARFSAERIEVMLDQLACLLEQIAAAPEKQIGDYSLITTDTARLLPSLEAVLAEPAFPSVTRQLRDHAARTPHRTAVVHETDGTLDYNRLAERASALAQALAVRGVQAGDVVAVHAARLPELSITIMGVFMRGAVLLTLDPAMPLKRRRLMLTEADAKMVVGVGDEQQTELEAAYQWAGANRNLPCARLKELVSASSDVSDWDLVEPKPDQAAYIFFTSGSTGKPKGILGRHKGLSHFMAWQRETCSIGDGDRIAQLTGLSFDALLRDVLLPLTSGAALCFPDEAALLEPARLVPWVVRQRISLCHLVPSMGARWLTVAGGRVDLKALRHVFFVGEPLTDSLIHRWRAAFPQAVRITNIYGTTETTLAKVYYHVPARPLHGVQPGGMPLPQTQVLVLNEALQPLGVGEIGMIYIRTPFRTLGYINAADENTRLFPVNPRRNDPDDKLHCTGDLGRFRPDGLLEVLGRADFQVKIRGVRVEPGEVEALLDGHADVHRAAVPAYTDETVETRLIAFIQPHANVGEAAHMALVDRLRAYLRERLPEAMVPSMLLIRGELPLTPNGKLDRAALRHEIPQALAAHDVMAQAAFVEPQSGMEKRIAAIWADLLERERVGQNDDFFTLGGHSLLATQVISRVRDVLKRDLPLRLLFEKPRLAEFAEAIERAEQSAAVETIAAGDRDQAPPLSFAQRRLWFLDRLEEARSTYNIPAVLSLTGELSVAAMQRAILEIIRRHETLRTRFRLIGDEPHQIIADQPLLEPQLIDLSGVIEGERLTHHWIAVENRRPFDLSEDSPIRVNLLRLAPQRHILLMTMHHIISDGWSMGVLVREITALYSAFVREEPSPLPALPIQYRDFTWQQRQWFEEGRFDRQLAYWKAQLTDAPELITLPTDQPRPAIQTFRGDYQPFAVPAALTAALKELAQQQGVTSFMLLYAVFSSLLARYAGQADISVGAPIANRTGAHLEPMIGFFVNTLVLRLDLSDDPSLVALLARVKQVTLDAYANQDIPFEEVVDALQPQRSLSHGPLFQVMFALQTARVDALSLPGLQAEQLERDRNTAKFDLNLLLGESPTHISGDMEYNTDLFDGGSIQRLLDRYLLLLKAVAADPNQTLSRIPLFSGREREHLVVTWNAPTVERVLGTLPERFDQIARRYPERIALAAEDAEGTVRHLSYGALDREANRLAHFLQARGVRAESVVGLSISRGLDLPLSVLAVLKTGAAYLPLDPTYPAERLGFMLVESRAGLLLVSREPEASPPGIEILTLDQARAQVVDTEVQSPEPYPHPLNPAYVIFTSGSTGRPKGISMPHATLLNLMDWQLAQTPEPLRTLQFTSIGFDVALQELAVSWFSGGTLINLSDDSRADLNALPAFLNRHRVERLYLPFVALQHLAEVVQDTAGDPPNSLVQIITAGEQLRITSALKSLAGLLPGLLLRNEYGPAETHVVTAESLTGDPERWDLLPPIGRPLPNCPIYILDKHLELVAGGLPGRLYIGGVGPARGYHQRPELTASRFIPDPFSKTPGGRLYDSGDLARLLTGGRITFMGRADQQVKIRGYRVEPAEIEAVLAGSDLVRDAVVTVYAGKGTASDERLLVAYVVPSDADMAQESETVSDEKAALSTKLRAYLAAHLPAHMIPTAIMPLDALPLTPTGKVNRRALPAPITSARAAYVEPRNELEEKLADIWREVLKRERVGVYDNFFELGGHSLLATQVVTRIRGAFGVSLPLANVFNAPTIDELAKELETLIWLLKNKEAAVESDEDEEEFEL